MVDDTNEGSALRTLNSVADDSAANPTSFGPEPTTPEFRVAAIAGSPAHADSVEAHPRTFCERLLGKSRLDPIARRQCPEVRKGGITPIVLRRPQTFAGARDYPLNVRCL
jgi:hypothetical protein